MSRRLGCIYLILHDTWLVAAIVLLIATAMATWYVLWGSEILPGSQTETDYDNFMAQLATAFKGDSNVSVGLMNEPIA